ncbi:MAG: hypothetical protein ACKVN9_06410 [Methylophilaceae bacterium]
MFQRMKLNSSFLRRRLSRQKGIALLMVIFFLGLGATAFLITSLNKSSDPVQRDIKANEQLAEAKTALMSYVLSVGTSGGATRPGDLLLPDANSETPGNYDGTSDGGCLNATQANGLPLINSGTNMRCLGRFPWQSYRLTINNFSENDGIGSMPWYAISANLVDPLCIGTFNPSIANLTYTTYTCPATATNVTHPWLTVRDTLGNVLSSRVAAILFMPGPPVGGQSRPVSPNIAGANQYLDSITVLNTCTTNPHVAGTFNNADMDNDFIKADDSRTGANNNPCYGTPYQFNDKLVYITIDELIAEATKRAAAEVDSLLTNYNGANGHFPYAAPLGASAGNFNSSGTSTSGMVPIDVTDTCSCSSSTGCSCSFGLVASVTHTRASGGNYTVISGSCTRSGTSCTCTGAGSCANVTYTRHFDCDLAGVCSFTGTGTSPHFIYTLKLPYGNIVTASSSCSKSGNNADCTGVGSFTVGLNEVAWFSTNLWQNFFYYNWTAAANLQIGLTGATGTRQNVRAIIIGTGAPIINAPFASKGSAQTGVASATLDDYLDSTENTDGDIEFDATNKLINSSYNDQVFVISP